MERLEFVWHSAVMIVPQLPVAERRRALNTLVGVLAVAVLSGLAASHRPQPPVGELRIVGSRAMTAPAEQWAAIFRREYPQVRVSAALYGSGVAAGAIADKRADVAPLSRPMDRRELAMIDNAPQPVAIRVGNRAPADEITPQWVYLYVSRGDDGRVEQVAEAFARIALSREGQARIGGRDFRALSPGQRKASLDRVARLSNRVQESGR